MNRRELRDYLEYQSDRVEALLAAHGAPGRVTGGAILPQLVRLRLRLAASVRYSTIQALADDLALALRVRDVRVTRGRDSVLLEFETPAPRPVAFEALLRAAPATAGTALLGMTTDGIPLEARLGAPEVAHILVAGTTGSGKSVLLRVILASLLLRNSPKALCVAVVDGKGRLVPPGFATPHVLRVASRDEEMRYVLRSLVQLMERRDEQGIHLPRVVVLVDELADLVMSVEGAEELLVRLVQRGREAGVHMVAATQRPSAAILSGVLRANFPLRLVGRVASTHDARVAAGRGGTDAHQLTGRGDFLAVWSEVQRFQVPLVTRDDLGDLAEGKRATPALALPEVAPEANATDGVAADAARLLARAAEEGRRWRSKREAEQWLCGYSGGAAFERTGAALAWIEAQQRATTTTQAQLTASAVA